MHQDQNMEFDLEKLELHASDWSDLDFDLSLSSSLFMDMFDKEPLSILPDLEHESTQPLNEVEDTPAMVLLPPTSLPTNRTFESMTSPKIEPKKETEQNQNSEFREKTVVKDVISRTKSGIEISWTLIEVGKPDCIPEALLWIPKVSKLPTQTSANVSSSTTSARVTSAPPTGNQPTRPVTEPRNVNAVAPYRASSSATNSQVSKRSSFNPNKRDAAPVEEFVEEEEGGFKCHYCESKFSVRSMCKRHVKIHEGRGLHYCPRCRIPYKNKFTMWKHLRSIHNDDSRPD